MKIYQLKVELDYSKPPIWRRIEVPASFNLEKLHKIIQIVMGWESYHAYGFEAGGQYIAMNNEFKTDASEKLASKVKLEDYLGQEKDKIAYTYDYGDNWMHTVTLEKILSADDKTTYPRCITGKGACPPEDCGGLGGYYDLLEVLKNPDDPDHADMLDWLGLEKPEDFDPGHFSVDQVNKELGM